jgi:hypothetical protein
MRLILAGLMLALTAHAASSQTLTAVRPGLMCMSAEALAALTRPDGSSRASDGASFAAIKLRGGCFDLVPGDKVSVVQARHNTALVHFDGRFGGAEGTYLIANVDFALDSGNAADVTAALRPPPAPADRTAMPPRPTAPEPPTVTELGRKTLRRQHPAAPPLHVAAITVQSGNPAPPQAAAQVSPPATPIAPQPGQTSHGPDVAGLRLGMDKAAARARLDPHLADQDRNLTDPDRSALVATSDHGLNDGTDAYEAYLLEFVHGKLAYIHHAQIFAAGSEPLAPAASAALTAKYGHDADGHAGGSAMSWSRGAGDQSIGASQSQACLTTPQDRVPLRGLVKQGGTTHYDEGLIPRAAPERVPHQDLGQLCSQVLYANAKPDPKNGSLIKRLDVVLFDAQAFFALDAERAAATQNKNAAAAQAAKVNQMHL